MPTRRRTIVAILSAAIMALTPGIAAAKTYQGTIAAPTVSPDGRTISASVTMTAFCNGTEYCGFFPVVTTVPDTQPCQPTITGSSWVGDVTSPSVGTSLAAAPTANATWSEYPTLYSGGKRACLYAMSDQILVAETTYQVPAPPPAPVYAPPATVPTYVPPATPVPAAPVLTSPPVASESLSRIEAIGVMRRYVKKKYGRRWTKGRHHVTKCPVRSSAAQLGCYSVWLYKKHAYSKSVVITESADRYTISRDFASAPSQAVPSTPAPAVSTPPPPDSSSSDFCATHVCIPNYDNGTGSTVQCTDGTYSQSGGKQGACSHHGGVRHGLATSRITAMRGWAASRADARVSQARQAQLVMAWQRR